MAAEEQGIGVATPEILEKYLVSQPMPDFGTALQDGCTINAFRSGGGLHVVRIEKGDALVGYGEHPFVEEALAHAREDFEAGGRNYKEVYGEIYPHYLTGSHDQKSRLGLWLAQGYSFSVEQTDVGIQVSLFGYEQGGEVTEEQQVEVLRTGEPLIIRDHGYVYEVTPSESVPGGVTVQAIEMPEDGSQAGSHLWESVRVGTAPTLTEAFKQAFEAEPQERPRD